jgi:chloride channel 7
MCSITPHATVPCTQPPHPACALPQVGLEISSHILAVAPAMMIGLVAGLVAVAFTIINLRVARLRDAIMSRFTWRWKKVVEPCIIVVIYITGCMVLPLFSPCTPTECFTYKVRAGSGACLL